MAHHHVGHFLGVGVLCGHVAYKVTVAENGDPVGKVLNLVHLVGDDDHGLASVAHIAQNGKELVGLLGGENGGRLVQNQDVSPAVENLYYLNGLLLGHGHIVNLLVGVHLKAVGIADLTYLCGGGLQIQFALKAEDYIFSGGEHVHQLEVLVYHADAKIESISGRADDDRLSVNCDLALVGEIDAGEHIHKRGLAAAVFAQQRKDLAPVDVKPDLVVGYHRAKGLCDISHCYCGGLVVQRLHSPCFYFAQ